MTKTSSHHTAALWNSTSAKNCVQWSGCGGLFCVTHQLDDLTLWPRSAAILLQWLNWVNGGNQSGNHGNPEGHAASLRTSCSTAHLTSSDFLLGTTLIGLQEARSVTPCSNPSQVTDDEDDDEVQGVFRLNYWRLWPCYDVSVYLISYTICSIF